MLWDPDSDYKANGLALGSMGLTEATKHVPAGSPKGRQFAKGTAGTASTAPSKHYTIVGKGVKPARFTDRMGAQVHKDTEQSAGRMDPKAYVRGSLKK